MKSFLFAAVIVVTLLSSAGLAHPPKEVTLTYDFEKQFLIMNVTHGTGNGNSHFINKVVFYKNGEEIDAVYPKSQPALKDYVEEFELTAEPGDTFSVKLFCNKGGSAGATVTVSDL